MKFAFIRQKRRFRRTTDSNHAQPVAPYVLERDFATEAPNEAWVTDVNLETRAAAVAALTDYIERFLLDIVVFIEDTDGVVVRPVDLVPEKMRTIASMAEVVRERLGAPRVRAVKGRRS